MMTKRMRACLVTLALTAAGTSCSDERSLSTGEPTLSTGTGPEVATGTPPPANEVAATLSSTEVVDVTTVFNLGEVARGEMARERAVNGEVKDYAARMVTDYRKVNEGVLSAAEPRIATDPRARVRERHQRLITQDVQAQTGAAFDLAYMSAQVEAQAEEIATLERSLLPSVYAAAQTPSTAPPAGLRGELEEMRAMVAQHLVEALQIEQRLLQTSTSPPITPN